jgi:hypothetical protein
MKKKPVLVIIGVTYLILSSNVLAEQRHVPSEYPTIQDAIDAANNYDVVLVADGTYVGTGNRDIDFKGKAITVRSENGPENCIIDCQRSGRGFYFHSGEDTASVLDGLTITNGYSEFDGGGICCWDNSNPTIINCDIIDNMAFFGGGIAGYKSKPAISNCFIACNSAVHFGGGLNCLEGPISNSIITANKTRSEGGGLCLYDGDITNCLITGNTASFGAGLYWCKGNITGCTISGNKSEGDSGGIESCHGLISNCIIWGNIAERNAQIFNCTEPTYSCVQDWPYPDNGNINEDPLFVAPSLAWMYWELVPFCHWKFDEGEGDTAYDSAGNYHGHIMEAQWVQGQIGDALRFNGEFSHVLVNEDLLLGFTEHESFSISAWIKCNKDSSDIINKGFMDGTACDGGYDLGIYQSKLRFAINDYDNTFTSVSGITDVTDDQWHYVVAIRDITEKRLHLYVDGSPDAMPVSDPTTTWIGSRAYVLIGERYGGIIDELTIHKTAFTIEQIQQFYEVGLSGQRFENEPNYGDYHLLPASPCIDTGDPNYEAEPNETDLDGNARVIGGRVDMGAYEFNHIPIADAGPNQIAYALIDDIAEVFLDGNDSYDPDGDQLSYSWSWTVDNNIYEANGVSATIELPVGQHTIELIVNDGIEDSEPNEVTITVVPPIEVAMKFTPQVLNLSSGGKLVKAHFVLPEGFSVEDVDVNTPAVIEPYGVECYKIKVLLNDEGLVRFEATFRRSDLCSSITSYDVNTEVMVTGRLTSGQYFYGTDVIKITN